MEDIPKLIGAKVEELAEDGLAKLTGGKKEEKKGGIFSMLGGGGDGDGGEKEEEKKGGIFSMLGGGGDGEGEGEGGEKKKEEGGRDQRPTCLHKPRPSISPAPHPYIQDSLAAQTSSPADMDFLKDVLGGDKDKEDEEEKKGFGFGDFLSLAGGGGDEKKKKEDGGFSSMVSDGVSMLGGGGDEKGGIGSVIDGISNVNTMSKMKKVFSADGTDEAVSEAKNLDKKDVDNLITMAKDLDKDDLGKVLSFLK